MKRLIVVLLVALLAVALVACGGDTTTTKPKGSSSTTTTPQPSGTTSATPSGTTAGTPSGTTAGTPNPPATTPDQGGQEDPPVDAHEGDDLVELGALNFFGDVLCQFEFMGLKGPALTIFFTDFTTVYQELVPHNDDGTYYLSSDYNWVVTVDGVRYEIDTVSNYTIFDYGTYGYIRLGMGENFKFNTTDVNENGEHGYEILLEVFGLDGKCAYWAWLAHENESEEFYDQVGLYWYVKPETDMIGDSDRPASLKQIEIGNITLMPGGPSGATAAEGPDKIFDGDTTTKLCTNDGGSAAERDESGNITVPYGDGTPIEFKLNNAVVLAGVSIVNANDNANGGRTLVNFRIEASNDGSRWVTILDHNPYDSDPNYDKGPDGNNYQENFYAIDASENYTFFRLVPRNGEMYQLSELLLWVEG